MVTITPEITSLEEAEKAHILHVLKLNKYNRTHTAIALNIGARTLQRKLKRWDMQDIGKTKP